MDQADSAQIEIDREQERRHNERMKAQAFVSNFDCKECGDAIPEARRQAISTEHCVHCASINESIGRHFVSRR